MEPETLTCTFCGAPYTEVIPSGTVQVKCKYCRGTILVPPFFGGALVRCPNHSDILAVGLCNDCGGSYCDSCLYFFDVQHGTLHLCPNCFRERQSRGTTGILACGVLWFLIGLFAVGLAPDPGSKFVSGVFLVFAFPITAHGIYRRFHFPKGVSVKERTESIKTEIESRKAFGKQASLLELYNRLLSEHLRNYGPELGWRMLERRIDLYVSVGMARSEAVRKVAEEKGY